MVINWYTKCIQTEARRSGSPGTRAVACEANGVYLPGPVGADGPRWQVKSAGPLIGAADDQFGQRRVVLIAGIANSAVLLIMTLVVYGPVPGR